MFNSVLANSMDPDQARRIVGPDQVQTVCHFDGIPERFFFKKLILKNVTDDKKAMSLITAQLIKQGYRYHKLRKAFFKSLSPTP